ncbi:methylene-tetrahydromethanopterin dehydrogenase N-terminal domain-containing protein [Xanthobacter tagetidis]|uniref:Methylenetetrahydromethanopterin dehydrogenase n=1 Tax=Xanthobacter tagetidis TaxID=60216 RepID=A0A3L7A3Z7_9HYPH|nr:methylene-tetrahydromethanopterin dehydrogenase N-terminal domain-containing protein [Xanthobacter tagetidis]MBB6308790.1 methylene-tetrahydromethanopterin dehydrogenase [Xanthobacter tagetidis]RLP74844.1 methylenetetrahydromethanopterin dehydrogenase [Xanthobacter tagetidis]
MADPTPILHMISPLSQVSPFDVNMAFDAGYGRIAPYPHVTLDEVRALTQDMMFSRPPAAAARTALFIGGRDASLAFDMAQTARAALFPPFEISVFPDPAGAFTTAAAVIAKVERQLSGRRPGALMGAQVKVFGGTGVVGSIAAVIAAEAGAKVTLVSHRGLTPVTIKAAEFQQRFRVDLACANAETDAEKAALLAASDVVISAGRAGVEILSASLVAAAETVLVAADVNAVPPAGIAGIGAHDDGAPLAGGTGTGIGPLAIGDLKYRVQQALFRRLLDTRTALFVDLPTIFALARELA